MTQLWNLNNDGSKNAVIGYGNNLNQALQDANLTVEEYNKHKHLFIVEEVTVEQI